MPGLVPVYVLTGFLGAGKTTLLNALLAVRAERGRTGRVALVVNELGEIGVDGALLPTDAARQIELPGGCVCCALGPELDATLLELLTAQPGLEAIVLETTGVAEPLPIAWALEREPLATAVRLGAIITVFDATAVEASLPLSPAVREQLRHADVLVLSKGQLVPEELRRRAIAAARALAPRAPLLDDGVAAAAAWLDDVIAEPRGWSRDAATPTPQVVVAPAGRGAAHGIASVGFEFDRLLDLEELEDQLAALPAGFVRIKGLAHVVDGRRGDPRPHWAAFHRVGLRVSSEPVAAPVPPQARVVGLGPAPDGAALRAAVEAAAVPAEE
ncbi:MAG: GTP-binding protein [Kofleriaceae bacterium]